VRGGVGAGEAGERAKCGEVELQVAALVCPGATGVGAAHRAVSTTTEVENGRTAAVHRNAAHHRRGASERDNVGGEIPLICSPDDSVERRAPSEADRPVDDHEQAWGRGSVHVIVGGKADVAWLAVRAVDIDNLTGELRGGG